MDFGNAFNVFFESLGSLFTPSTLVLIVIGVVIGSLVGFLPGLGSIAAMALLLPFTYGMSPFEAFALLLGMYAVVATMGDLTSILFGVPGSPDAAALIVDGHPLATQGQARRAMAASVAAGTIGALIGAGALAVTVVVISPFILAIGSPETLMLTLLGISVLASVSGRSLLKGVIAGCFGLLLSTVGPNAQTGIVRYGFGWPYLIDGLPLVAVALGLFAIPEVVGLHRSKSSLAAGTSRGSSSSWHGTLDAMRHFGLIVRSSVIGVATGALPGIGGSAGQWMAYAHAKHTSKTPELFGKGAIEGVIAPGATNNSREGGGLIPTVAFGVPGSGAMAVLLGAFLVLGIRPGPDMLTVHLDITFFMVWVLVVANILGSLLAYLLLKRLERLTFIRGDVLAPFITVLIFVGAVSATGQTGDLLIAMVTGLVAIAMQIYRWPVVPLLLGLVLGHEAENNLNISVNAYGWVWLTRPLVLVIAAVLILMLILSTRQHAKEYGDPKASASDEVAGTQGSVVLPACVLVVAVAAFVTAQQWPIEGKFFPQIVSGVLAVLAAFATLQAYRALRRPPTPAVEVDPSPASGVAVGARPTGAQVPRSTARSGMRERIAAPTMLSGALWLVAAAISVVVLGFACGLFVFVLFYLRLVVDARWWKAIAGALAAAVFVEVFLVELMGVQLPPGVLLS